MEKRKWVPTPLGTSSPEEGENEDEYLQKQMAQFDKDMKRILKGTSEERIDLNYTLGVGLRMHMDCINKAKDWKHFSLVKPFTVFRLPDQT